MSTKQRLQERLDWQNGKNVDLFTTMGTGKATMKIANRPQMQPITCNAYDNDQQRAWNVFSTSLIIDVIKLQRCSSLKLLAATRDLACLGRWDLVSIANCCQCHQAPPKV